MQNKYKLHLLHVHLLSLCLQTLQRGRPPRGCCLLGQGTLVSAPGVGPAAYWRGVFGVDAGFAGAVVWHTSPFGLERRVFALCSRLGPTLVAWELASSGMGPTAPSKSSSSGVELGIGLEIFYQGQLQQLEGLGRASGAPTSSRSAATSSPSSTSHSIL